MIRVENDWIVDWFTGLTTDAIIANIPQTLSKATRELSWINRNIKKQMKQRKKLYNCVHWWIIMEVPFDSYKTKSWISATEL